MTIEDRQRQFKGKISSLPAIRADARIAENFGFSNSARVTGLAWVVEDMFPRVRLLLQPVGNVASRFRPAARAAISVLPRTRAAIVIFVLVISCGAYFALRPLLLDQNSAISKGITIKANPFNQFDPHGTKTPVYELTDKDGSVYTVDAPDENAAVAAFEALRHCKRPYAERVRIYDRATGAWTAPIQIQTPDGSIAEFPDGMATADIEAVLAKLYPLAPKWSLAPLVPAPPVDPYAAFSSPAYPAPAGRR